MSESANFSTPKLSISAYFEPLNTDKSVYRNKQILAKIVYRDKHAPLWPRLVWMALLVVFELTWFTLSLIGFTFKVFMWTVADLFIMAEP